MKTQHGCDLGHGQRRGVRREDRIGSDDRLELPEELVLDRELFERGFDHDVTAGEIGQLVRQREPRDCGVPRVRRERPLLDLARQEVRDPVARLLGACDLDLAADRCEFGLDRELCDAGAHRAEADHADRADLSCHGARS